MQPLVSILIPAYNAEKFIGDSIKSAMSQTWRRKEVIVIDDGSTDATLRVAEQFASSSVRVVHQENQGAAAARNHALSVCQGDYIQWLDADDLLSVDKVHQQMRVIQREKDPHKLASSSWGYFRHRPWKATFTPSVLWHDLGPIEWIHRKWTSANHMQTATWLVSRELSDAAGPWDTRLRFDDDGEYFTRVVLRSSGVRFVPDGKVYYRVSPSTRLSYVGTSNAKIDGHFLSMELQIGYLRSVCDDERTREACTRFLETWMHHFYPTRPDIVERAQTLANSWGAQLRMPRLPMKYEWFRLLFGETATKVLKERYNQAKSEVLRKCDYLLLQAQGGRIDVSSL